MISRNVKVGSCDYKGQTISFNFYTSIRVVDKVKFVSSVVDTLVNEGIYLPFLKNMIFDFQLINVFTDLDISDIKESADTLGTIEEFLEETNVVDILKENVDSGLIEELMDAIDDNIEYLTGIHKNHLNDALTHLIKTIEDKLANVDVDKMMEMANKMSTISGEFTADKVLDAYSKTDMFKNKIDEMLEEKRKHEAITKEKIV